jgi:Icc-related predicted phosphoesterase
MAKPYRVFFASDVHGSRACFRKFLGAAKFYESKSLIIGGDLTGKGVVPLIKRGNHTYTQYHSKEYDLITNQETQDLINLIHDGGMYPLITTDEELNDFGEDRNKWDEAYKRLCLEEFQNWMDMAEQFTKSNGVEIFIQPGNDDIHEIDPLLDAAKGVINTENKMVYIADYIPMISTGWTNKTPWNTERELTEDELSTRIELLVKQLSEPKQSVFNFHVPPHGTNIDEAPSIDSSFSQKTDSGQIEMAHVGSTAVRAAIEKYQPMASIHGHIHESRGLHRIGKTVAFNPGSEYTEGILRGVLLVFNMGKKLSLINHLHVSG